MVEISSSRDAFHRLVNADEFEDAFPFARARVAASERDLNQAPGLAPTWPQAELDRGALEGLLSTWTAAYRGQYTLASCPEPLLLQLAPSALCDGAWLQRSASAAFCGEPAGACLLRAYADEIGVEADAPSHAQLFAQLLEQEGAQLDSPHSPDFAHDARIDTRAFEPPALLLALGLLPRTHLFELLGVELVARMTGPSLVGPLLDDSAPVAWTQSAFFREHADEGPALARALGAVYEQLDALGDPGARAQAWARLGRGVRLCAWAAERLAQALQAAADSGAVTHTNGAAESASASGPTRVEAQTAGQAPDLRQLYHQLLHIEEHPEARPAALGYAHASLDYALENLPQAANDDHAPPEHYAPGVVEAWVERRHAREMETYVPSNANEAPPYSKEELVESCVQLAPALFIDGAWVQGVGRLRLGAEGETGRRLFKVFYDEAGCGSVQNHHGNVYRALLRQMEAEPPAFDSADFARWPRFQEMSFHAPVLWMSLSEFPQRFLPETRGLNLAIELAGVGGAYKTGSDAMRYYGFNPHFLELHEEADDVDDGHTAWSLGALTRHLEHVAATGSDADVQAVWRRVRTGLRAHAAPPQPPRRPRLRRLLDRLGWRSRTAK